VEDGGEGGGVVGRGGGEVEAAGEGQHGGVLGEDLGDDGGDFFGAGGLDSRAPRKYRIANPGPEIAGDYAAATNREVSAITAISERDWSRTPRSSA